jgi:hypothetical protein
MAIAYDAARQNLVVFGGIEADATPTYAGTVSDETWTWDGHNWTEHFPSNRPSPRLGASMAYDAARKVMVLYGGWSDMTTGIGLDDTWTWDGTTWTEQHALTTPQRRGFAPMAYDAGRQVVVMFGGHQGANAPQPPYQQTWTWNGTDWALAHPVHSPSPRYQPAIAYDMARADTVLFGGLSGPAGQMLTDTWTWDGDDWTQRHPAQNPPVDYRDTGLPIVYDSARKIVVGPVTLSTSFSLSIWTWDGTNWTARAVTSEDHPVADDTARGLLIGLERVSRTDYQQGGIAYWDGQTWSIKAIWREPTVLDRYDSPLAAGIAGVEARTGFTYSNGACVAAQPCLASAQVLASTGPPATPTVASVRVQTSGFWPGFTCTATVADQSDGWHFQFPVVCS